MGVRVVWFRRDLRVRDHEALVAAVEGAGSEGRVLPLFVWDPRITTSRRMADVRLAYLADALEDLDGQLRERGARLVVRHGDPREVVPQVACDSGAEAVHACADVTAYSRQRDEGVADALHTRGIGWEAHGGVLAHPPGSVLNQGGEPYKVFTAFHRAWSARRLPEPLAAPREIPMRGGVASDDLPPQRDSVLEGGETAAQRRLQRFLDGPVRDYATDRDRPDLDGTSRLSADLHFGCLSARDVLARLGRGKGPETFAKELAWRDFYGQVLHHWPHDGDALPWRRDAEELDAWREGRTGYPIVDAGMRQLRDDGWMHNRVRMIVASFLSKDLLIDWRLGEAHFLRHLVDGDMANNRGGWMWAAGVGTDAQPFFRIFNPVRQGERFDPDGAYVRRYVAELRDVPTSHIHHPWDLADPPPGYPPPIVDHAAARARALKWFATG